jgi:hypothetical protein
VGPGGGRLAKSPGRSAMFYVGLAHGFVHMCLHEMGKAKAVENVSGGRTTWPAGHHLVSYRLNQVGNPSLDLANLPTLSYFCCSCLNHASHSTLGLSMTSRRKGQVKNFGGSTFEERKITNLLLFLSKRQAMVHITPPPRGILLYNCP